LEDTARCKFRDGDEWAKGEKKVLEKGARGRLVERGSQFERGMAENSQTVKTSTERGGEIKGGQGVRLRGQLPSGTGDREGVGRICRADIKLDPETILNFFTTPRKEQCKRQGEKRGGGKGGKQVRKRKQP